jgi:formamidopyrimidine-DNA glycosylase
MPEGPDILCITIYLREKFSGGRIEIETEPKINEKIKNGTITEISSKGKVFYFRIVKDKITYYMHLHLGLAGWVVFEKPEYSKYDFTITKNETINKIYIEDKIRLSSIKLYNEKEHNKILEELGIDIFRKEFTINEFREKIKSKKMLLVNFLLKQEIFSGIGNYIKNEVLYLGKLNIKIKTNELTEQQITDLYKNILFVSYSCLLDGLINLKMKNKIPEENKYNMPKILEVPYKFKIYKRKTTDKGEQVKKEKVGGRDTYYI